MRAILRRFADAPFGVFGYLDLLNEAGTRLGRFHTCEEDWLNNVRSQSCIPEGLYLCRRGKFPRTGEAFEVTGVPGRSAILIHAGNTEEDIEGCILLGEAFGALTVKDEDAVAGTPPIVKWGVVNSKPAITRFHGLLAGISSFPLAVQWATPGSWRV